MAIATTGLQSHIWNNNLKSIGLLAFYPFLIAGMAWACVYAFSFFSGMSPTPNSATLIASNTIIQYWPMILAGVVLWFVVAYFFHTKMIRNMAHSHPVTRKEEPALYNLFENLCISVGLKTPRLEIIESHARNAFASGINDKTFTVTVTRGLMQSLSKDMNRDVRLLIITIIFTGMVGFAAQLAWSQLRYKMWFGGSRSSQKGNGGGMMIFLAIVAILWIGYFATLFTRFALSRRREFMADAGAVQITRNPDAMMRALMRIAGKDQIPKIPGDIAMMCVENRVPFMGLFATHPPIEKRIKMLSETTGFEIPALPQLSPFHAPRAEREDTIDQPENPRKNWTTRERFKSRRNANPWR